MGLYSLSATNFGKCKVGLFPGVFAFRVQSRDESSRDPIQRIENDVSCRARAMRVSRSGVRSSTRKQNSEQLAKLEEAEVSHNLSPIAIAVLSKEIIYCSRSSHDEDPRDVPLGYPVFSKLSVG